MIKKIKKFFIFLKIFYAVYINAAQALSASIRALRALLSNHASIRALRALLSDRASTGSATSRRVFRAKRGMYRASASSATVIHVVLENGKKIKKYHDSNLNGKER
ncbi:MAG: hypothetical protein WHV26_15100 [Spirochaetota bacterium]